MSLYGRELPRFDNSRNVELRVLPHLMIDPHSPLTTLTPGHLSLPSTGWRGWGSVSGSNVPDVSAASASHSRTNDDPRELSLHWGWGCSKRSNRSTAPLRLSRSTLGNTGSNRSTATLRCNRFQPFNSSIVQQKRGTSTFENSRNVEMGEQLFL